MSKANNTTIKIITLSGLDGSGKTTQIKLLKNYLETQKKRVFYFHIIKFSLANQLLKIFSSKNKTSTHKQKSVTQASWLQIQLRKIALWIDLGRFKKLAKKLEKENYDYILSDRFFWDSVVNIEYLENFSSFRKGKTREELEKYVKIKKHHNYTKSFKSPLIPLFQGGKFKIPNSIFIYLQISPQNIMNHQRVPDQGLEYLKKKKELYDAKIKEFNFTVINGDRNKEEIFEEIKKIINTAL